ncbi:anti-sigma factor antagonist [Blautia sp. MSJ-19]|uniref:anti-sigma factor antagonist n=1 Tax=Blautia sp. MSJ-19 TaxID=2841517 RepID=UPI001C0F229B|nr:anti-sigma factor antagonist [Blautia sp. MSJ-19]MBU5481193.1 anti-sigma factor antagonist [Blautia sp. MSJ-19]
MKEMFKLEGTTLVILVPEELDHPVSDWIRKEAEKLAGRTYIRTIVFDFSQTQFMDSSGVGLLMGRYRSLGMRKGCIQATGVSSHIDRLLHLSGLHRYIEIHRAEEEEKP